MTPLTKTYFNDTFTCSAGYTSRRNHGGIVLIQKYFGNYENDVLDHQGRPKKIGRFHLGIRRKAIENADIAKKFVANKPVSLPVKSAIGWRMFRGLGISCRQFTDGVLYAFIPLDGGLYDHMQWSRVYLWVGDEGPCGTL